jgi:hypothetical protein
MISLGVFAAVYKNVWPKLKPSVKAASGEVHGAGKNQLPGVTARPGVPGGAPGKMPAGVGNPPVVQQEIAPVKTGKEPQAVPVVDHLAEERKLVAATRMVENTALRESLSELLWDYLEWKGKARTRSPDGLPSPLGYASLEIIHDAGSLADFSAFAREREDSAIGIAKELSKLLGEELRRDDQETLVDLSRMVQQNGPHLPTSLQSTVALALQRSAEANLPKNVLRLETVLGVLVLNALQTRNPVALPLMKRVHELAMGEGATDDPAAFEQKIANDGKSLNQDLIDGVVSGLPPAEQEQARDLLNRNKTDVVNLKGFYRTVVSDMNSDGSRLSLNEGRFVRAVGRIAFLSLAGRKAKLQDLVTVEAIPLLDQSSLQLLHAQLNVRGRWEKVAHSTLRRVGQVKPGDLVLARLNAAWIRLLDRMDEEQRLPILSGLGLVPRVEPANQATARPSDSKVDWPRVLDEFRTALEMERLKYASVDPANPQIPLPKTSIALFQIKENQQALQASFEAAWQKSEKHPTVQSLRGKDTPLEVLRDTLSAEEFKEHLDPQKTGVEGNARLSAAHAIALETFWNEFVWRTGLGLKHYPVESGKENKAALAPLAWATDLANYEGYKQYLAGGNGQAKRKDDVDSALGYCRQVAKDEWRRRLSQATGSARWERDSIRLSPQRNSLAWDGDRLMAAVEPAFVVPGKGRPAKHAADANSKTVETRENVTVRSGISLGVTVVDWIPGTASQPAAFILDRNVSLSSSTDSKEPTSRAQPLADLIRNATDPESFKRTALLGRGWELIRTGDWKVSREFFSTKRSAGTMAMLPFEMECWQSVGKNVKRLQILLWIAPDGDGWDVRSTIVTGAEKETATSPGVDRVSSGTELLLTQLAETFQGQLADPLLLAELRTPFFKTSKIQFPDDATLTMTSKGAVVVQFNEDEVNNAKLISVPVDVLASGEVRVSESAHLTGPFARKKAAEALSAAETDVDVWKHAIVDASLAYGKNGWKVRSLLAKQAFGNVAGDLETGWFPLGNTAEDSKQRELVPQPAWHCSTRFRKTENGLQFVAYSPVLGDQQVGTIDVALKGRSLVVSLRMSDGAAAALRAQVRSRVPALLAPLDQTGMLAPHRMLSEDRIEGVAEWSVTKGLKLPSIRLGNEEKETVGLTLDTKGMEFVSLEHARSLATRLAADAAQTRLTTAEAIDFEASELPLAGSNGPKLSLRVKLRPDGSIPDAMPGAAQLLDGILTFTAAKEGGSSLSLKAKVWLADWSVENGSEAGTLHVDPRQGLMIELPGREEANALLAELIGKNVFDVLGLKISGLRFESGLWHVAGKWSLPLAEAPLEFACRLDSQRDFEPQLLEAAAALLKTTRLSTEQFEIRCITSLNPKDDPATALRIDADVRMNALAPLALEFAVELKNFNGQWSWSTSGPRLNADSQAVLREAVQQRIAATGVRDLLSTVLRGLESVGNGVAEAGTAGESRNWSLDLSTPDVGVSDSGNWRSWGVTGKVSLHRQGNPKEQGVQLPEISYRLTADGLTVDSNNALKYLEAAAKKHLENKARELAKSWEHEAEKQLCAWLSDALKGSSLAALGADVHGTVKELDQLSAKLMGSPLVVGPLQLRVARVTSFRPYQWDGHGSGNVEIHFAPALESKMREFKTVAERYRLEFDAVLTLPGGVQMLVEGPAPARIARADCLPIDELLRKSDDEIRKYVGDADKQPDNDYLNSLIPRLPAGEVRDWVTRLRADHEAGSKDSRLAGPLARRGAFRLDYQGLHVRKSPRVTVTAALGNSVSDGLASLKALGNDVNQTLVELIESTGLPLELKAALEGPPANAAEVWNGISLDSLAARIEVFLDANEVQKRMTGKPSADRKPIPVFTASLNKDGVNAKFEFSEAEFTTLLMPMFQDLAANWKGFPLRVTTFIRDGRQWKISGEIAGVPGALAKLFGLPPTNDVLKIHSLGFGPNGLDFAQVSIEADSLQALLEKAAEGIGLPRFLNGSLPVSLTGPPQWINGDLAFGLTGSVTLFDRPVTWRLDDVRIALFEGEPKVRISGFDCDGVDSIARQLVRSVAADLGEMLQGSPVVVRLGAIVISVTGTWTEETNEKSATFGVNGTLEISGWLPPTPWRLGVDAKGQFAVSQIQIPKEAINHLSERLRVELLGQDGSLLKGLPIGDLEFETKVLEITDWKAPSLQLLARRRNGEPIKLLDVELPHNAQSQQTWICDLSANLIERSVAAKFNPEIEARLVEAAAAAAGKLLAENWKRIEVDLFGERVILEPRIVGKEVHAKIRARLDGKNLSPPLPETPDAQVLEITALTVTGSPLSPQVHFGGAEVKNVEVLANWLTGKLGVPNLLNLRRLQSSNGQLWVSASLHLPGLVDANVDNLAIPLDSSPEALVTILANSLFSQLPTQAIAFGDGQQITLSPPQLDWNRNSRSLGFRCDANLRVLESPVRVEVPGSILLRDGNLSFDFADAGKILKQAVGQVLGPVLQEFSSSAGAGISLKNFNVSWQGDIPIGFQTGGAVGLDILGADFAGLSLEFDRCVVTSKKVSPPRVWKLTVPITITVPPAIDIYNPGGQYDVDSKELQLDAKVAITRQEATSNLLHFHNILKIPLAKPLRLSTSGKMFLFKFFVLGEVRGELDIEHASLVVDFETTPTLKGIIELKGHLALYCAQARFESDLSVKVLGCSVARSHILLDFKNLEFQVAGHVDLFLVKVDAAFTIEKGLRNPRLFAKASIGIGSLSLVWLELDLNARRVKVTAGVAFVHVTLTFPHPWAINGSMIEQQLLNLLNPVQWVKGLLSLFGGNFNISFGSPPGPGGSGGANGSGGEKGGDGAVDGSGGEDEGKENLVPPGGHPLEVTRAEGKDYLMQFYEIGGKRRVRLQTLKANPPITVDLRADFAGPSASKPLNDVESSMTQGRLYIRSVGIDGGTAAKPSCISYLECTGVDGSSDEVPMIVRWSAASVQESDIGRVPPEAFLLRKEKEGIVGPPQPPAPPQPPQPVPDRYKPVDKDTYKDRPVPANEAVQFVKNVSGGIPLRLQTVIQGDKTNQVFYIQGKNNGEDYRMDVMVIPGITQAQFDFLKSQTDPAQPGGVEFEPNFPHIIVRKPDENRGLGQGVYPFVFQRDWKPGKKDFNFHVEKIRMTFVPLRNFELVDIREGKPVSGALPARSQSVASLHVGLAFSHLKKPNPWYHEVDSPSVPRKSPEEPYDYKERAWPYFPHDLPELLSILEIEHADKTKAPIAVFIKERRPVEFEGGKYDAFAEYLRAEPARRNYPFWLFNSLGRLEAPFDRRLSEVPAEIRKSLLNVETIQKHPGFYRHFLGSHSLPLARLTENDSKVSGLFRADGKDQSSIWRVYENKDHKGPEDVDPAHVTRKQYALARSAQEFFGRNGGYKPDSHEMLEAEIGDRLLLIAWNGGTKRFATTDPASLWLLTEGESAGSGMSLLRFSQPEDPLAVRLADGDELKRHSKLLLKISELVEKWNAPLEPLRLKEVDSHWELTLLQEREGKSHLLKVTEQGDDIAVSDSFVVPENVRSALRKYPAQVELYPVEGSPDRALVALIISEGPRRLAYSGEPGEELPVWLVSSQGDVPSDILGFPWGAVKDELTTPQLHDPETLRKSADAIRELARLRVALKARLTLAKAEALDAGPWWFTCFPTAGTEGAIVRVQAPADKGKDPAWTSRDVPAPPSFHTLMKAAAAAIAFVDISGTEVKETAFAATLSDDSPLTLDADESHRYPLWLLTKTWNTTPFLAKPVHGNEWPDKHPCLPALRPDFWKPSFRREALFKATKAGPRYLVSLLAGPESPGFVLLNSDRKQLWVVRAELKSSFLQAIECPLRLQNFLQDSPVGTALSFRTTGDQSQGAVGVVYFDPSVQGTAHSDYLKSMAPDSNDIPDDVEYPLWAFASKGSPSTPEKAVPLFMARFADGMHLLADKGIPQSLTGAIVEAPGLVEEMMKDSASLWQYIVEDNANPQALVVARVHAGQKDEKKVELLVHALGGADAKPLRRRVRLAPTGEDFAEFRAAMRPNASLQYDSPLAKHLWSDLKSLADGDSLLLLAPGPKDTGTRKPGYVLGPIAEAFVPGRRYRWRGVDGEDVFRLASSAGRIIDRYNKMSPERAPLQPPLAVTFDSLEKLLQAALRESPQWDDGKMGTWTLGPRTLLDTD